MSSKYHIFDPFGDGRYSIWYKGRCDTPSSTLKYAIFACLAEKGVTYQQKSLKKFIESQNLTNAKLIAKVKSLVNLQNTHPELFI